ncbi:MAG: hypothetical protein J4F36_07540 [Nitrosopumilaceae archaeon]|nr:hypothetical protein [Nitrosopumilaceae archaeon]
MNYLQRAKKWYERALEESDEFVKFLLLYISFEVSTNALNHTRNIKNDDDVKEKFFSKISENDLIKLKEKLDEKPLQNMQHKSIFIQLDSIHDFENIIEFVIVARNNLFHGDKGLDETRDKFIVNEGNKILKPLLTIMLEQS